MKERETKVKAVKVLLSCLNDAPFKIEMAGIFWNVDSMAEAIVQAVEQVELDFEYAS